MNESKLRAFFAAAFVAAAALFSVAISMPAHPTASALVPSVVRLASVSDDVAHGSGVYIGHGLILTARHVAAAGPLVAEYVNDRGRYPVSTVWTSKTNDLAIVRVEGPVPVETAQLACRHPQTGEPITAIGSPMNQNWSVAKGNMANAVPIRYETYPVSVAAAPGDSGGPLFDAHGKVLAVISTGTVMRFQGGYSFTGYGTVAGVMPACRWLEAQGA